LNNFVILLLFQQNTWLSWLSALSGRTCGINQRVVRTCGTAGAEGWQFAGLFMFYLYIIYSASANKYYVDILLILEKTY
jgi:hypothetical protein